MISHLRRLHRWWLKRTMTPNQWAIHLWNVAYESGRNADWLEAYHAFNAAGSPEDGVIAHLEKNLGSSHG